MFKAAIKSLLGHKLRMFLTGFAIILGTSFVAGTYIFTDSISKTFDGIFTEVYEGVDLTVRAPATDFIDGDEATFGEDILEQVRSVDGVEFAEPGVSGFAQPLDKEGEPIGGNGPPNLAFSWTRQSSLTPLAISDGRPPEAAGEVVLDKATADNNGYTVGDSIDILFFGPAETFEVVGIATFGDSDGLAGATILSFELAEAQKLFELEGLLSYIEIQSGPDVDPEVVAANIKQIIPEGLEVVTGEERANEDLEDLNEGLGFINTAILAFAGVAIFVGSFIIQNTFRIIVAQRTKELALLRAIGASRFQVIRVVLYEALFIGVFASIAGIGLGVVISYALRGLLNAVGLNLPDGPLTLEPRTIIVSMIVGVGVTMVAAILPAIGASRVAPVQAMRGNEGSAKSRKGLALRGIIAAFISAAGAAALIYGLNKDGLDNPVYYVGFGAATMFIGVSVFAPLLSGILAIVLGYPARLRGGMTGKLATDNVRRTPRRTASSAAALMIGVSLVVFVSVLASSFKSAVDDIVEESLPADVTFISSRPGNEGPNSGGFSREIVNEIKEVPELIDVTGVLLEFDGVSLGGPTESLAVIDSETFSEVIKLKESENAYEKLSEGGIVVRQNLLDSPELNVGDTIAVSFGDPEDTTNNSALLEIVGSFEEPFDANVLVDTATYTDLVGAPDVTYVAANFTEGVSQEDALAAAELVVEPYVVIEVRTLVELVQQIKQDINTVLALIWGLLGLAIVIAVLGITNTLMLSISERTREIGMLRAIGMTRKQVRSMVRYESIIIALFGALLGVLMGIFFGWAVLQALESEGVDKIVLPYGQIVIYFVIAAIAGVLAAAWPARRASRMNVLDAISNE